MFIPSSNLLEILHRARTGIWTEMLVDKSIALVTKLPQSTIKKIYCGVDSALITSVIEVKQFHIVYLGLCVYDNIENPLVVIQPLVTKKAHVEFGAMVRYSPIMMHFFDEMCQYTLSAKCELDVATATQVFESIQSTNPYALSVSPSSIEHDLEFARAVEKGIDIFQSDLESMKKGMSSVAIPKTNFLIPLALIVDKPHEGFSVNSMGDVVEFTIDQLDEGSTFEKLINHALNDIYHGQTFLRPKVDVCGKERELTDVIAFDFKDNTICLIQAKVVGALGLPVNQSSRRRSTAVEKQVDRALKQLKGSIRHVRAKAPIFDCNGITIALPSPDASVIHAIVLVSELYPFADWRKIAKNLSHMSQNDQDKALFHVLDLQELQQLATNSTSSKDFHNYLLQRWVMVKKIGTAYVRSQAKRPYTARMM